MKRLTELVELFEKDATFRREWREDPLSAAGSKQMPLARDEDRRLAKIIDALRTGRHLKRQTKLFGM